MTLKPADIATCPSCGSQHIGDCKGLSFRQRLLSVKLGEGTHDTRAKIQYYNDEVIQDQLQTKLTRNERKADLLDRTNGFGYAETQPDGSIVARDPRTHERRALTPTEVNDTYLSNGTAYDE